MWVAVASADDGLGGADPVGFAPVPGGGVADPVLVVSPGRPAEARVAALGVVSSDAPTTPAGSLWATGSGPLGPDAALGVVAGIHTRPDAVGIADVHLWASMVHARGDGWALGSAPFFDLPSGSGPYQGAAGGGLRATGHADLRGLGLDANVGVRVAPRGASGGFDTGSAALLGLAATWAVGPGAAVVLEHDARAGVGPVAAESALSARGTLGVGVVSIGTALGWTDAPGVARMRGFVGLSARPERRSYAPEDLDGDGLTGARDRCPGEPETFDGVEDDDGCPEYPATVAVEVLGFLGLPVLDADTVLQVPPQWSEGAWYAGTVTHPAYRPYTIPPLPLGRGRNRVTIELVPLPGQLLVTAVDGLDRALDVAVELAGEGSTTTFDLGPDGRETVRVEPGQYTLVARAPGRLPETRRVVVAPAEPVELDLVLHDQELVFTGGVLVWSPSWLFEDGSDELLASGAPTLDQLANLLRTRSEPRRLAVRVWTDPAPDEAEALHLSQRRANNVAGYLYGRGVDAGRLGARGMGPSPDGARVEFVVTD